LAARSQFSVGLGVLGATVNNTGADGRFFSWLGQFQWVQALNEKKDFVFVARAAAQLTPDSLLPLEQFSIGGIDTVRGYRTNQRLSNNGILGSAELRFPIVRDPGSFGLIQLAPFVDIGAVWGNDDAISDSNTLLSAGLGLRWQLGSQFSARLDWGIPLVDIERQGDSLQDDGLHFSVRWQPF
jgi:hemolysin activation/secretion protein